ncbi:MAG: hypothetical protein K2X09_07510, partial [Rickettsiales bacterium]|nr:hypothetical protein [Rickettsiales bacterium]
NEEAEMTGQWKSVTGEQRWNVSTAGEWRPEAWTPDLERADLTALEINFAETKRAYEEALKAEGAQAFDRTQAEALAAKLTEFEQQVKDAKAALEKAEGEYEKHSSELAALSYGGDDPMTCPDCGAQLALNGERHLVHATSVSEEERDLYHNLGKLLKDTQAEIIQLREALTLAQHRLASAEEATTRLAGDDGSEESGGSDTATAKAASILAEKRLDAFNTSRRAYQLYERILTQKDLVTALSQNGVRKNKLDDQLKRFNEEVMKPLSVAYGGEHVWLDAELNLWRGNRAFHLLSRSAQFAASAIMQAAIAMADRSELLVIDDMDEINDRRNRAGLMAMVQSTGIPALVCMAKRPEENAPDLAARNAGQTFTVIDGVVQPFAQAKEASAV